MNCKVISSQFLRRTVSLSLTCPVMTSAPRHAAATAAIHGTNGNGKKGN